MNWDHIRSFESVARLGSLSAAARELRMTQPAIGRHIDLLETELGLSLFTRGREGMLLTEKGQDLVESSKEILRSILDFERRAVGLEERLAGTIRISVNDIFGPLMLPNMLASFMQSHPEVDIEIDVSNQASNLLKRDADIAIRMFRPTQNDLIARKICDVPLGLFAHETYLARRQAPSQFDDLKQHVLIGQDRDMALLAAYRALGLPLSADDFALRCDSNIASINAIRAGLGIGPLHLGMVQKWSGLVQILPDLPVPKLEIWLACHADVRHNQRIRVMMDYLADLMRDPYAYLAS